MSGENKKKNSGIRRYFAASHRTSSLRVITFDRLLRTDHTVWIVNLSVVGVGVESNNPIQPGLVSFDEPAGGHKFGVVTWCRENGDKFQAGINFVTLPKETEQLILKQFDQSPSQISLPDPDNTLRTLVESVKPGKTNNL